MAASAIALRRSSKVSALTGLSNGGQASLGALDRFATPLPRFRNAQQIGAADRCPHLLATGGIACDDDERLRPRRLHAHIVTAQFRIGFGVSLGARFEERRRRRRTSFSSWSKTGLGLTAG